MTLRILVVDDDKTFAAALVRSFSRRGFVACAVHDMIGALQALGEFVPTHVVLDLKLGGDDGLFVLARMRELSPDLPILLLTGYASITTAVESIKRGAMDYLPKPADAAAILRALGLTAPLPAIADPLDKPLAWNRVEWEHIQRVLHEHKGNIAATARSLGMHRRTLQRKLHKRAPQPQETD